MEQKVYEIENLCCANCAAKIEAKINELPEVESAVIVFPTKQLRLTAEHPYALIEKITAIAQSVALAKKIRTVAWQNVIFALAVKAAVMVLGLLGFASMWLAVFADSGVAMLCVLNSIRLLYKKA